MATSGLPGQTRLPQDTQRARRNAGRMAAEFSAFFGNGFTINPDGTISVLAQVPILVDGSGVGLNFSTGLQLSGSDLITNDSEIVHDDLSGFVGNEHIDWTNASDNFKTVGTVTLDIDADAIIIGDDQDYDIGWDNAGVYGYLQLNTASSFFRIPNAATNYVQFAKADGYMEYVGDARPFERFYVDGTAVKLRGVNDPVWSQYALDGRDFWLYWLDPDAMNEVYFTMQLPHRWDEEDTVYPHVHWTPNLAGAAAKKVRWGLQYTMANEGAALPVPVTIYGSAHSPADASLVNGKHYTTPIGSGISMSGMTLGATLLCRLFRDAADAADDYTGHGGLIGVDLHYRADTEGSRQEFTK